MNWNRWVKYFAKPFDRSQGKQSGMTIIEILIVIALIGTIMTIVVKGVLGKAESAKKDLAKLSAENLSGALNLYKMHNGRYPTTEESLQALMTAPGSAKNWRGPYTDAESLLDPWQNPFAYEGQGAKAFQITSGGSDGIIGNEDDVRVPDNAAGAAPQ